jgi:hypothetical protein
MRILLAGLLATGCAFAQQALYEDARVRILVVPPSRAANGLYFTAGSIIYTQPNQIVIELLPKQTNPRNVCREVLPGEYLHCRESAPEWLGANLQPQFETDQTHIGILQIAPGATLAVPPFDVPPLLIALDGTEAEAVSHANGAPAGSGSRRKISATNVLRSPADQITEIRNTGKAAARFLVVEFGGLGE